MEDIGILLLHLHRDMESIYQSKNVFVLRGTRKIHGFINIFEG